MLTLDDIRQQTPSVFATQPWDGTNPDSYRFIPTSEIVAGMMDQGFVVTKAMQSKARIPGKQPFTKHMLRLRHGDYLDAGIGTEVPEVVLVNSHDRSSAYRLYSGVFRMVCSNGMVIQEDDFGNFSLRHIGGRNLFEQIKDATARIMDSIPAIMRRIDAWKNIILPRSRQIELAEQAWKLKPNDAIRPAHLLTSRRPEDATNPDFSRDLWTTTQVVQENLMRGGLSGTNSRGRRVTTRPIKSVTSDLDINRSLWELTQQFSTN